MATPKTVWGIDIGQVALKALKLRGVEGELQVEAFDIIEHPKILSQPDADRKQLIRNALEQFLARNNVVGSTVAVSVPGQSSFTRFVKLPPVEPSKIPDIVRYEAEQQIPFPINDVIWRWQTFLDPDSPDVEVGIFAMKKVDEHEALSHFAEMEMPVDVVQMAPLALYNFMTYDGQLAPDGATLLADVGADKTDLVVADGPRLWTRTIQIGGNNFTEALVRAFKLSFSKAEKLKRTAASSKYARQIFQAMRPVFADLVQEINRSIGFYTTLHRDTRFKKLIGLGNGFRLPGLQKFLEQNLNMPVARIDNYNKLSPSQAVNTPTFTENVLSFALAYGLALQGMGLTTVTTNMLPQEVSRARVWSQKRPWFAAAGGVLLLALAAPLYSIMSDIKKLPEDSQAFLNAKSRVERLEDLRRQYDQVGGNVQAERDQIAKTFKLLGYRDFWPSVESMISASISAVATDQGLLTKYAQAPDEAAQQEALAALTAKPRDARRVVMIDKMSATYQAVLPVPGAAAAATPAANQPNAAAQPVQPGTPRKDGFKITLVGRTTLSARQVHEDLLRPLIQKTGEIAKEYKAFRLVEVQVVRAQQVTGEGGVAAGIATPGMAAGPRMPDPLVPTEDMINDTVFEVLFTVAIDNDGITVPSTDVK